MIKNETYRMLMRTTSIVASVALSRHRPEKAEHGGRGSAKQTMINETLGE